MDMLAKLRAPGHAPLIDASSSPHLPRLVQRLTLTALFCLSAMLGTGAGDANAADKAVAKPGDKAAMAAAQKLYQQERAACLAGTTGQEREACLREAAAALKEAGSGRFNDDTAQIERNRLRRCEDLSAQDKLICERKMRGEGETSGSVQGGGVVRRIVTVVPAPAASAPSN